VGTVTTQTAATAATAATTDHGTRTPEDDDLLTLMGLLAESWAGVERFHRRNEAELGLPLQWMDLLVRLVRTPGHRLRMTDLAAQSILTPSGLTRAVDRLVEAGLVVRETCPDDRRGAYAALTPDGRARIEAALPRHVDQLGSVVFAALDADDRRELDRLLRLLRSRVNPGAEAASRCPTDDDAATR
jgi:DNA-binding MarR family transcriptional regulator